MSKRKPMRIEIREMDAGLNPSAWLWQVLTFAGGVRQVLASGRMQTGAGALYAAVMEARLYEPSFEPAAELMGHEVGRLDAFAKVGL